MSRSYGWEDYLGDTLRGNVPVNQLIPQHPYLLDTLQLEEVLHKNTEHIMLLTTDEASAVVSELYNIGTTYAGNIKDSLSGVKNISKLVSYKEAGKIILNLKGLGIKAQTYMHQGVTYIKITGYPSLRRILNGTRYTVNNPKILDVDGKDYRHYLCEQVSCRCLWNSRIRRYDYADLSNNICWYSCRILHSE